MRVCVCVCVWVCVCVCVCVCLSGDHEERSYTSLRLRAVG